MSEVSTQEKFGVGQLGIGRRSPVPPSAKFRKEYMWTGVSLQILLGTGRRCFTSINETRPLLVT